MGNHEDNKESDDGVDDYDYEYDDPNDPYLQKLRSTSRRTSYGLEVVAIHVQWLNDETTKLLELSTL